MARTGQKNDTVPCPSCNNPVQLSDTFCEQCGQKLVRLTCPSCKAVVPPGARFCESCGTPLQAISPPPPFVQPSPEPPLVAPPPQQMTAQPEPVAVSTPPPPPGIQQQARIEPHAEPAMPPGGESIKETIPPENETKGEKTVGPVHPEKPVLPAEPVTTDDERGLVKTAGSVTPQPKIPPAAAGSKIVAQKPPLDPKILIAGAGVIVILAAVYFVGLPLLDGKSSPQALPSAPSFPFSNNPSPASTNAPSGSSPAGSASLSPLPTETLPQKTELDIPFEKSALDGTVTVRLTGGNGISIVKVIDVRLTRSDGQVVTGTIRPAINQFEVSVPGTKQTDRIEILVTQYSGKQYRVVDQLLPYRSRG